MKFQLLLLFLTAVTAYAPTCKAPPKYCKYTSPNDLKQCRKLFTQRYINIAQCQLPAKTVTKTRTVRATSVTTKTCNPPRATKKVTRVITKTGKPTTQPTITLTDTTTKLETTTRTDVTIVIEVDTVIETETVTDQETETTTTTTTSFTTVPFAIETSCTLTVKRRVAYGNADKKPLPTSCSCFLTSTKPAATKTAFITKRKPAVTRTVYKVGGPRQTITRTITVIQYTAGPTLSAPETTTTSTTTLTQTDVTVSTETDHQTSTDTTFTTETMTVTRTETTTARATATAGPCDDVSRIRVSDGRSLSHPNVILQASSDAFGPDGGVQHCCAACYNSNGCVFFRVKDNFCERFHVRSNVVNPCPSLLCLRGKNPTIEGVGDGKPYYVGPCVGPQVS